jgi:hypothetical protein
MLTVLAAISRIELALSNRSAACEHALQALQLMPISIDLTSSLTCSWLKSRYC